MLNEIIKNLRFSKIYRKAQKNGLLQFRAYDKFLLSSLEMNKIIFGAPKRFNDPFDCNLPIDTSNSYEEILQYLENINGKSKAKEDLESIENLAKSYFQNKELLKSRLKERVYDYRRFSCLNIASTKLLFGNSLFWANYAGKHKGICLKFRGGILLPQNHFRSIPIKYVGKIPSFNFINNRLKKRFKHSPIEYYFGIKSKEWKHENEVRLIYESESKIKEEYIQIPFNPFLLEKVYLGCNLENSDKDEIIKILNLEKYSHVKISGLKKDSKSFKLIEYKMNRSLT